MAALLYTTTINYLNIQYCLVDIMRTKEIGKKETIETKSFNKMEKKIKVNKIKNIPLLENLKITPVGIGRNN